MSLLLFDALTQWDNLLLAFNKAAKGKRGRTTTAAFEAKLADNLLQLQAELQNGTYRPKAYTHFFIHEPKRRRISAARFRDRVVHHALCQIIEPLFEKSFIFDSYANRVGKGTHKAIDRFQYNATRFEHVLRCDIVQHFAAIDHQILIQILGKKIDDKQIMALVETIIASGRGVLDQEYEMAWFPGDDLLSACRYRGLPIGNLTSQFWSNCYLDPLDHFIKRDLRCKAYLRYVDDFALFSNSRKQLWFWKKSIIEFLSRLRLTLHETSCQVVPTRVGVPWLGFVVYPEYRKLKGRKARYATRRLSNRYDAWQKGGISFGELDASIKGWVNHVRYADTWRLRKTVFRRLAAHSRGGTVISSQ